MSDTDNTSAPRETAQGGNANNDVRARAAELVDSNETRPVWVWSGDGGSLIWANEPGLGLLEIEGDDIDSVSPTAPAMRSLQAVARTQAGLAGRGRIEILRISAGGHQETLVATCKPVMIADQLAVLALGSANGKRSSHQVPVANMEPVAPTASVETYEASRPIEPIPDDKPVEASFLLDIDVPSFDETAATPPEAVPATPDVETAALPAFVFKPRSRPHRFSFMVDQAGCIRGLSTGLAEAVGPDQAMRDGDFASETLLSRVGDLPPAIFHGIDERRRFSEHEVMWPVSDTNLAVPVRLSGFDEDDGSLRVFGTALTGKADDRSAHSQETKATDDTDVPVEIGPATMMPAADEHAPSITALDDTLEPEEAESAGLWASEPATDADAEPATAVVAQVSALVDELNTSDAQAAGLWSEMPDSSAARVQTPSDVPDATLDEADDNSPAFPAETVNAMNAVAKGIAAGLPGGVAGGVAPSPHEDKTDFQDTDPQDHGPPSDEPVASVAPADDPGPIDEAPLSRPERLTFQEIARRLGARISGRDEDEIGDGASRLEVVDDVGPDTADETIPGPAVVNLDTSPASEDIEDESGSEQPPQETGSSSAQVLPFTRTEANAERMVLDRLPLGVIIYSDEAILYANRAALDLTGITGLQALRALDGIEDLFADGVDDQSGAMTIVQPNGTRIPVQGRLQSVRWDGQAAALLSIREHAHTSETPENGAQDQTFLVSDDETTVKANDGALPLVRARIGELEAIIDLASDGVVTLDSEGEIKDLNQAAQALVGYAAEDLTGRPFRLLFPEDSRQTALDYLEDIAEQGHLSLFNEGRELECITAQGGLVPVFMTLGRLTDDQPPTFCAVLRDLSPFKQAETDLVAARKAAEEASAHKSDFLARVSHEIRTPLNAVIGFSEVMLEERFGPVGSERYRQYLRDIHTSGEHLMSLLNDLLDLSKIEAGKMELTFSEVDLNDVVQQCLAIMQPQASQGRIIVRTSLPLSLPKVVADLRSVRQVVLNLMSNAIKFTDPGGQIIVSTLYEPSGEVSLRVRDTGRGMNAADVKLALEPFRQVPTTLNQVITGTGLGLPLTKALVEANRAQFGLESTPGEGTLAMMTFPSQRVLAE